MEDSKTRKKLLEFVKILKEANVTVSTPEVMDMFGALQYVDFTDRTVFKTTLSSTLIKDYTDIPIFEKCFTEFFEKKIKARDFDYESMIIDARNQQSAKDHLSEEELQSMNELIDDFIDSLTTDDLSQKSARDILKLMLEDPVTASSSGAIGMMLMNKRSRQSPAGNHGEGEPDEDDEITGLMLARIQKRKNERNIGRLVTKREEYLLHKFLYQLKPAEVKEMREIVKRMGQKLKNRISLRKKKVKHGGLDVKRTFRFNLHLGGIPFKLFYKDKKIDRPQLTILCDISSSVNQYSRFMLLLTYTLQSLFSKVRTFAFISHLVEITPLFMEMNPEKAINSIFTDTNFTYGFGSNYGRCFDIFIREFSDSLNKKTTVMVLGDARNNNQSPGLESFIKIKERSRNLFWLNPEKRHLWDWSDSIAGTYMPYCTEMKEVNTILDLSEFIDKLFIKK